MLIVLALAVLLVLWYFFRPERLFINKKVDEPPPQSGLLIHSEQAGPTLQQYVPQLSVQAASAAL
jgi:hypothetical protein